MRTKKVIPSYSFSRQNNEEIAFKIQRIDAPLSYSSATPHRHNYYEIFFFIEGGGIHSIDFNSFNINAFSLHFISPGQVHHVKRKEGAHGYLILFPEDFFSLSTTYQITLQDQPFLNQNTPCCVVDIEQSYQNFFIDLFRKINFEYHSLEKGTDDILRSYLFILFKYAQRFFEEQHPEYQRKDLASSLLFSNFKKLVEQHYTVERKLQFYTDKLNTTIFILNNIVKYTTGVSASDFIHKRLILEAKRLLCNSKFSCNQVAYDLGFDDPSYFSRYFKKKTGLTITQFRANQL